MAVAPLPADVELTDLARFADDVRDAVRAGEADAIAHLLEHAPGLAGSPFAGTELPPATARDAVARHFGQPDWAALDRHVAVVQEWRSAPDAVGPCDAPADEAVRLA